MDIDLERKLPVKTIDIRTLINKSDVKRTILIPQNIKNIFDIWKKRISDVNPNKLNELEIFYAGYLLSNPMLREELDKSENPQKYNI